MAKINIKGNEYAAKCGFKFDKYAEKHYSTTNAEGQETGGYMNIYMSILQNDPNKLVAFWDCALEYLGTGKPSIEEIEEAVEAKLNENDVKAYQEAFDEVDQSGFFRLQAKKFWKNLKLMKQMGKTDEEKEENLRMYNMMVESREDLVGESEEESITTNS